MINHTSFRNYTLLSLPPITAAEEMTSARPAYDFKDLKKGETETTETTNQTLADMMSGDLTLSKRSEVP
jgi:hypothetical protein